jgi:DNA repair protein RecO (recombination protein O)
MAGIQVRLEKYRALILETRATGEADLIVWAITSEGNQLCFVAKGARKTKSRFAALVQPFTLAEFIVYRGSGMPILRQADSLETFSGIRGSFNKCLPAFSALELCRLLIAEEAGEIQAFSLTYSYLRYLNLHTFSLAALNAYRLQLSQVLGYGFIWDICSACGNTVARGTADWSGGGLVCGACGGKGPILTPDILAIIRFLCKSSFASAQRLAIDSKQLARTTHIIDQLFNFLTEGKTKLRVLECCSLRPPLGNSSPREE